MSRSCWHVDEKAADRCPVLCRIAATSRSGSCSRSVPRRRGAGAADEGRTAGTRSMVAPTMVPSRSLDRHWSSLTQLPRNGLSFGRTKTAPGRASRLVQSRVGCLFERLGVKSPSTGSRSPPPMDSRWRDTCSVRRASISIEEGTRCCATIYAGPHAPKARRTAGVESRLPLARARMAQQGLRRSSSSTRAPRVARGRQFRLCRLAPSSVRPNSQDHRGRRRVVASRRMAMTTKSESGSGVGATAGTRRSTT